jgi:hypothetical protein
LKNLWRTREAAAAELSTNMKNEAALIEDTFGVIDEIVELLDSRQANDSYARACGFALAKARNLALGCFSLVLDGLGQEAGALMRPMIEAHELLVYFRLEPAGVDRALQGRLPPAGEIAKRIKGQFQDFRKHLNEHASHFGFSTYSLRHLLDGKELKIRTVQPMLPLVLLRNIRDLWLNMILLLFDAFKCLEARPEYQRYLERIGSEIEELRERARRVFDLDNAKEESSTNG